MSFISNKKEIVRSYSTFTLNKLIRITIVILTVSFIPILSHTQTTFNFTSDINGHQIFDLANITLVNNEFVFVANASDTVQFLQGFFLGKIDLSGNIKCHNLFIDSIFTQYLSRSQVISVNESLFLIAGTRKLKGFIIEFSSNCDTFRTIDYDVPFGNNTKGYVIPATISTNEFLYIVSSTWRLSQRGNFVGLTILNNDYQVISQKTLSGSLDRAFPFDIIELSNGNILIAGITDKSFFGGKFTSYILLIEITKEGDIVSRKEYKQDKNRQGFGRIIEIGDHEYILNNSLGEDICNTATCWQPFKNSVYKIDKNQNKIWESHAGLLDSMQVGAESFDMIISNDSIAVISVGAATEIISELKFRRFGQISKVSLDGEGIW